jgi:predicted O-methyltransferase YrrM
LQKHSALLKSALNPVRFPVMLKKLKHRFLDRKITDEYNLWLASNSITVDNWCASKDPALWAETQEFLTTLFDRYKIEILPNLPQNLGGNACVRLLYFMTRYYNAETIVETGVALGFSSQAFLTALKRNGGNGRLYSSDFPYFRIPDAERYIGIVVQDDLKANWQLYIDGDDRNLPKILAQTPKIDFFHYDSDKTYSGRVRGYETVKDKLTEEAIIVFDDIQDNPHFKDFVETNKPKRWRVLKNRDGGYVGLINRD